jgi:hypothetical protein
MPPEEIDSLDAKNLKGVVLSLLARIDELFEQNKKLLEQNSALLARIVELENRGGKPPKTPANSSVPPSRGQKGNVRDASGEKKGRKGRPGVTRELCPNPDVTCNIFAERCDCGGKVPHKGQVLAHAYDHVELPPIKPVTTRINLHSGDCDCCGKTVTAKPLADMPPVGAGWVTQNEPAPNTRQAKAPSCYSDSPCRNVALVPPTARLPKMRETLMSALCLWIRSLWRCNVSFRNGRVS